MVELIFDLETKKWFDEIGEFDPGKLGVSVVSMYFRKLDPDFREIKGEMHSFWEKDFDKMWRLFFDADRIIGFNSVSFDVPALKPYAPAQFAKLAHFDILEKIETSTGHKVSLNRIAHDTIGEGKIDSGENATIYFKKGDKESLEKLQKYCEADVAITTKVYDFGFKNKFLKFKDHWNNPRQVEIDFSYPVDFSSAKQSSLF